MILSAIVALSQNRVIGRNNQLPWRIPADLQRFKKITSGHPVIMGRKTFESIGKVLPGRKNIIISRQLNYKISGAEVFHSLEESLMAYKNLPDEVFIIGGAQLYQAALSLYDRIYLTIIHQTVEGDAFFPEISMERYRETAREDYLAEPIPYSYSTLERIVAAPFLA
jgi:dihydrofolate reductase